MLFTREEIESFGVIHSGHFEDLVYETDELRVWVVREPDVDYLDVRHEELINGRWIEVEQYFLD